MTPQEVAHLLLSRRNDDYRLAIVLGSGLGPLAEQVRERIVVPYRDLPGFPVSGVSSHCGEAVLGRLAGLPVVLLSGRLHYYEHGDARAMSVPIETVRALGCPSILLTNAAGSVREGMAPGSLMLISDHINYSGLNPLIGAAGDERFVDMSAAYDKGLAARLRAAAAANGTRLHEGVYMWFSGPSFETPAEIRMARTLGADAVGMSTVPEVILSRYFGLKVAAISSITNYGSGMSDEALSHEQTKSVAAGNLQSFGPLLTTFCEALHDD